MTEIILAGDSRSVKTNPDLELSLILDQNNLSLKDSILEIKDIMESAKEIKGAEALKVRADLVKHVQALHGSKASMKNINLGVFIHAPAGNKLNY